MKRLLTGLLLLLAIDTASASGWCAISYARGWCATGKMAACEGYANEAGATLEGTYHSGDYEYCNINFMPKPHLVPHSCQPGYVPDFPNVKCIKEPDPPEPPTAVCEKHKGTVLHDQRASGCTSNGKLKFYIGACEVINSAGGIIVLPPEANPSWGYLGDWVITGLPKSACTPEGEKPEEPSDPEKPEENKCPEGSTWSGTTCIPNSSGEGEGEGGEGGSGGGSGGGGEGGSSGGSGGGGSGGGSGGNNPIGGDGDGEGGNGSGGTGTGEGGSGTGGNGDGGDCDPNVEECGEGNGSSVNGGSCDQPISCKGDVIQCAQLEKQWEIKCGGEELYKKDADINRQLQQLVDKNSNPIPGFGGESIPETNIGDLITEGSGWLPRSCPAPMTVTVSGTTLTFPFTKTCELANSLSGLIVALFAFLGIRVFGRQG